MFEMTYHVLDVEAVLCESEDETSLAGALIAEEDNFVLHLIGLAHRCILGHQLN